MRFGSPLIEVSYQFPVAIFLIISPLSLSVFGFYEHRAGRDSNTFSRVMSGMVAAAFMTATCLFLTKTGEDYSRLWLSYSALISVALLYSSRWLLTHYFINALGKTNILLVGGGVDAKRTAAQLKAKSDHWVAISEVFVKKTAYSKTTGEDVLPRLQSFIESSRTKSEPVSEVWLTFDFFDSIDPILLENFSEQLACNVVYVPKLPEHLYRDSTQIELVEGLPAIHSRLSETGKLGTMIKSAIDKCFASLILIILSPLLLVVGVAIKIDSKGPVFYKQRRYGFNGEEFTIWKFRTMYNCETEHEFKQATHEDSRITKIGNLLRTTSLDELPQLINVLDGSMSLVGPRPHPNLLNEQFREEVGSYMRRHNVKPGITGLAQINGFRGETKTTEDMQKRIELDLQYIKSWTPALDLIILCKTAILIFKHPGK